VSVLFFFFQAEDGIRDFHVTGVQTCALPIWRAGARPQHHGRRPDRGSTSRARAARPQRQGGRVVVGLRDRAARRGGIRQRGTDRSEERRVGKECRRRWWAGHSKKEEVTEGVK